MIVAPVRRPPIHAAPAISDTCRPARAVAWQAGTIARTQRPPIPRCNVLAPICLLRGIVASFGSGSGDARVAPARNQGNGGG
jgi:hypothetical protein